MKLWDRMTAQRRRKAHERYLQERDRQRELSQQDAQQTIRNVSIRAAGNQQGGSFQ